MDGKILLSAADVGRSYPVSSGTFWAVRHVSLSIPQGAFVILRGPSGSGKTTLLNMLGALDLPTEGKIILEDREINLKSDTDRTELRRSRIGYVFQSVALIPMMTAYENIDFALRMARYPGERKERVMECLHLVGLSHRAQHMPSELSGGEQQRVAIARAIAHRPAILLADEPTGALDTASGLAVAKVFRSLTEQNVTVIMTTHDEGLMELGDLSCELRNGELVDGE